ncbi:TPA: hypothetical protein QDC20_001129 [Burkholderia aenigmatica]|nr:MULTISPECIES: hypothetical protein [Burkholderia]MDN7514762.1 hypothetical protein [Burkholderia sp. AU45251]HDR9483820.1 hypothetical protein [Burkholderia aenigmatica]HDR9515366.1 hypothetical protein [Burkholderia aenigmatica]HDR9592451.1 hypothetical protein [Burkholderia aenigmatica]HDR9601956.1 hypothetical protein [Burkholderia aenigmatica]
MREDMQSYNSLVELVENIPFLPGKDWIYANLDSWKNDPEGSRFFHIPWEYIQSLDDDGIYLDDEDMEMPKAVESYNLRCWMLVNQLDHILKNKIGSGGGVKWFVDEVNYYRENDRFRS